MKTVSKILIALCLLANAQALTAQEQDDPLYRFQWHLSGEAFALDSSEELGFDLNSSTKTVHLNVAKVWKKYKYKGEDIYIAIVEGSPMDINHPDLKANIANNPNCGTTPTIQSFNNLASHGTQVAGVAAARDYNGIGVRGVAPRAKMLSLKNEDGLIDAMACYRTITAVSNHSYSENIFDDVPAGWYSAIEAGINEGFHGKGIVYVFTAGNEGIGGDNANYNANGNYHAGVTVCGVDYRGKHNSTSEPGANLWVCALDADVDHKYGIVTTNLSARYDINISDGYDINTGGTSFSAPMVSGIVALMRQANSNLGWRDVKVILADSAVKTDPDDEGWEQSGMKYGLFGERYHFNHKYGFGRVDAKAAVDLAEEWVNLPPREEDTVVKDVVEENGGLTGITIDRSLDVQSAINFIEHVDVTVDFKLGFFLNLSIELVSPSGTTSILGSRVRDGLWRFGSSRHLGEPASGEWHLIVRNEQAGESDTIKLRSWELRIRGYQVKLEAVAAGDLSDLNQPPLTLSLHGAHWKKSLEPRDFRLRNAPENLSIASVTTTTEVQQIQLKLELTGGDLDKAYDFQVVATTGTVSNHSASLRSNDLEIARIAYNKEAVIPRGTKGFSYFFTAENLLRSPITLSYTIEIVQIVDEEGNEVDLGETGLILDGPTIGGTPKVAGDYYFKITATRDDGISRAEDITLNVQNPYTLQTQLRVFLEGLSGSP